MKPYNQSLSSIATHYDTHVVKGLTDQEVKKRLIRDGYNTLPEEPRETWFMVFITQFQNPLIYILVAAAAIIFFFGNDPLDAFIISGVLVFNALIGTIQEGRTRSILDSLKKSIKSSSIVIRDGRRRIVDDAELVVGDLIELKEGQRIPADARVIFAHHMQLDESLLTGESHVCHKAADPLEGEYLVADQKNMVFRGTYIIAGYGKAIVVAIGEQTEIGKIHKTIEEIQTEMPLQQEVNRLAFVILLFILGVCASLFLIGLIAGKPLVELLVMLTALFICVVPEGLPVVLTLVLVSGVYRLAHQKVLVKNLQAVEALGRTNVIVIDKTGTLTKNEMMVSDLFCDNQRYHVTGEGYATTGQLIHNERVVDVAALQKEDMLYQFGVACALISDVDIIHNQKTAAYEVKGDPTEAALAIIAKKIGINTQEAYTHYSSVYEIPFTPSIKYHAHLFNYNGQGIIFVSGTPELLLQYARTDMTETAHAITQMLNEGLRVVAVGMTSMSLHGFIDTRHDQYNDAIDQALRSGIQVLGVVGIQDAIRSDINTVIDTARDAGMHIVIATGDHQKTAVYVAKKTGIYHEGDLVIDGAQFAQESDQNVIHNLEKTTVYARVSPDDKLRIVQLFQKKGAIVAMTGDGINDAPSLVAADLGIAMGGIGAEVAKQAADIVLLDDSFSHVIEAIKQGRHIFYTLKRVILYFFATNMGEILIVLFALVLNAFGIDFPLPITAAQILWLNLVTDGFLDIALSMEPQEDGLLQKRLLKERLVDIHLLLKMLFIAVPMALAGLGVFFMYYTVDLPLARTMTLITLAMFQWFNAWNCRSMSKSIIEVGVFSNTWLLLTTGFVLLLQLLVVYTPYMHYIFKTVSLSGSQWMLIFALSAPIILLEEMRKYCVRTWLI